MSGPCPDSPQASPQFLEIRNPNIEIVGIASRLPASGFPVSKQIQMTKRENSKPYDLEDRTREFAKSVRVLVRQLPKNTSDMEDGRQLVRSSGSVGANYIEANEALSKKDFKMRIKICRKEAKESRYWLDLLDMGNSQDLEEYRRKLNREATELMNIFGAILQKAK